MQRCRSRCWCCCCCLLLALAQVCGKPVSTSQGKCLRPEAGRAILYLRDINLPK